jgi:hypothetical protein
MSIVKLEQAVRLLNEASTLEELMTLKNMARAAELYAQAQQLGAEAEMTARRIKLLAGRKAGQLLAQIPRENYKGVPKADRVRGSQTLFRRAAAQAGISRSRTETYQKMARIPDELFDRCIDQGWTEENFRRGTGPKGDTLEVFSRSPRWTPKQTLKGLEAVAIQIESLAEALDGDLMGDWSTLYESEEAQRFFETIEGNLPMVNARLKRALRSWKEKVA